MSNTSTARVDGANKISSIAEMQEPASMSASVKSAFSELGQFFSSAWSSFKSLFSFGFSIKSDESALRDGFSGKGSFKVDGGNKAFKVADEEGSEAVKAPKKTIWERIFGIKEAKSSYDQAAAQENSIATNLDISRGGSSLAGRFS